MQIDRSQFEAYEAIILSGQMDGAKVPRFIEENPAFGAWYKERMSMHAPREDRAVTAHRADAKAELRD